jgi:sigma-70-like protein
VPQPPQVAEQRARFLQIVGEIDALPARQREALLLNEFEGRCYADIAAQLGTSESGVRGLLRRARRQLRETAAAVLLPIPVLRELVRSDSGRNAGELIGSAGAAGGISAAGGFAKVAAGVLAAGTIAGGGTAIQHSDESWRAPDSKKAAADVAAPDRADNGSDEPSVLVAALNEAATGPSAVSRIAQTGAQLAANAGLQPGPSGGSGGGIQGIESEPQSTAQPVETVDSPSLLPVEPLTPDKDDTEEEPAEETDGDEAPASDDAKDDEPQSAESTDPQPAAKEQPGPSEHADGSSPNAMPATPPLP